RHGVELLLAHPDAAIRRAAPVGPAVAVFHEPREGSLPDVLERHRITSERRPDRGRTRRGRTRGPRLSTPPSGRRRTRRGPHPGAGRTGRLLHRARRAAAGGRAPGSASGADCAPPARVDRSGFPPSPAGLGADYRERPTPHSPDRSAGPRNTRPDPTGRPPGA